MSDKLLDIAKANGASHTLVIQDDDSVKAVVHMDAKKLRATVEQVCAPLVAELVKCKEAIEYFKDYTGHQPGNGTGFSVQMVIDDYSTIIGDKE